MKVLVTGSEGFIGSNLVQYTHPSEFEIIRCDLVRKPGVVSCDLTREFPELPSGIDACVHLASHNIDRIDARSEVEATVNNLRIIDNVVKGCAANKIKLLINASSSSVYASSTSPLLEVQSGHPTNAYGFSQLQVEHACNSFASELGLTIFSVRLFNVLGFNQKQSMFPWKVLESLDNHTPLDVYGDSYQSWTHVRSVVEFLKACVKTGHLFGKSHNVFNYGSPSTISQEGLLRQIASVLNVHADYHKRSRRTSDVLMSYPSMDKTIKVFGSQHVPSTDIMPAIRDMIGSYKHNKASAATSVEEYDNIMKGCFSHVPQPVSTVFQRT